ncbi:MAG: InlB B-repeat-containing protein, partial [Bacilli bacterium]|nr:InlB B-repeat-containing protein [Bacilli bacterium]
VTSSLTIEANYVIKSYLVSFKDDNGYILDSQLVLHGSSATAPSAPSKEGYTFKSWDKEFTNVTSNLEVKATYDVNSYQVMFKDGETVLKEETVLYGASATSPVAPEKTGYTFTGWSQDFSKVTSSLTIEANYVIKSYLVSFKDDNGYILDSQLVLHGSSATAPTNPVRDGYSFTGWDKPLTNITSVQTITAQYQAMTYLVKFVDYDGTQLKEETVEH